MFSQTTAVMQKFSRKQLGFSVKNHCTGAEKVFWRQENLLFPSLQTDAKVI